MPVHKKNDRLDMENYRPVRVQTFIDKVFEKLLANQMTARFNERLSNYLTAHRKRHSCETVDRLGKLPLKEQQLSRTQHFIHRSHAAMFVLQAQYGPWGIPLTPMIR